MKYNKSDFATQLGVLSSNIGRLFNENGWNFDYLVPSPLNAKYLTLMDRRVLYLEINRDYFLNTKQPEDKVRKLNMWGIHTQKYDLYCLEHIIDGLRVFLNDPNNKHFVNHYADDEIINNFIVGIKILFTASRIGVTQKSYYIEQYDSNVIGKRINTHMNIYYSDLNKPLKSYTFPKII